MMKKIFTITWILFAINFAYSQNVTNIETKQAGDNIEISYDLDKEANIEIFISENGGRTFSKITKVTGDVGDPVYAGRKKIVWNVLEEYDNFLGNAIFKVTASPSLKAKQQAKEAKQLANQNLNGSYISLGSSLYSFGYYGMVGLGYEYRYKILGVNASVGYSLGAVITPVDMSGVVAQVGFKLYVANKKKFFRNLYFNILPFCYMGKTEKDIDRYEGAGNYIYEVTYRKIEQVFSAGIFLGYMPVWHLNEKVALGFNLDIGTKISYTGKYIFPVNWDLGFVVKF